MFFAVGFALALTTANNVYSHSQHSFSLLPVPEPPVFSLVAQLQESDAAIPGDLSLPPVLGEEIAGYVVSDIRRVRPVHPVTGQKNVPHRGFDIATPVGTPVYAPFAGEVVECQKEEGWGIYGIFSSPLFPRRYWLLHHLDWCQMGPYIKGDIWAKTGSAGTGPHLHIEGWIKKTSNWEDYDFAKGWIEVFLDASSNWLGQ